MGIGFITDNEIDRILGRMGEKSKRLEEKPRLLDRNNITEDERNRLREEYSRKKSMEFATNRDFAPTGFVKMNTFTNSNPTAGVVRRTYAFCADLCISGLVLVGFVYASMLAFGQEDLPYTASAFAERAREFGGSEVALWMATLYALILFFYFVFFDGVAGRTPGKLFLNVKLVDKNGNKPSFVKTVLRTMLFMVPPLGLFGVHNMVTGTKVANNE